MRGRYAAVVELVETPDARSGLGGAALDASLRAEIMDAVHARFCPQPPPGTWRVAMEEARFLIWAG